MFMEEWLNKLATLDNAHQQNLQQFIAERVRVTAGTNTMYGVSVYAEPIELYDRRRFSRSADDSTNPNPTQS